MVSVKPIQVIAIHSKNQTVPVASIEVLVALQSRFNVKIAPDGGRKLTAIELWGLKVQLPQCPCCEQIPGKDGGSFRPVTPLCRLWSKSHGYMSRARAQVGRVCCYQTSLGAPARTLNDELCEDTIPQQLVECLGSRHCASQPPSRADIPVAQHTEQKRSVMFRDGPQADKSSLAEVVSLNTTHANTARFTLTAPHLAAKRPAERENMEIVPMRRCIMCTSGHPKIRIAWRSGLPLTVPSPKI